MINQILYWHMFMCHTLRVKQVRIRVLVYLDSIWAHESIVKLYIWDTSCCIYENMACWGRILVEVTIYRRLLIGRDGHLDQSEAYDISLLVREYEPRWRLILSRNMTR